MFHWLDKLLRRNSHHSQNTNPSLKRSETEGRLISKNLTHNKKVLTEIFNQCSHLVIREIQIGRDNSLEAMLVYLEPLVNAELLERLILRPLMDITQFPSQEELLPFLKKRVVTAGKIIEYNHWADITDEIARGLTALFINGQNSVLLFCTLEDVYRSIDQPTIETVAKGPCDAFNEDLRTNIALLLRRLPTPRLAVEKLRLGAVTRTEVNIVYLKGYVMPGLIEEIKQRIERIKVDNFIGTGQLEEYIQDNPYSPFNTIESTERPDRMASHLLEGRAGILMNNTPFALIVPITIASQLQSPEDYYNRYWFSSFIRFIRWISLLTALFAPSLYIAITTFHQELVPTFLLISIVSSREGVPFPSLVEALIMELTFEVLREAGIRLPRPFGQTISIVGAVVIGQAAVSAGLVSPVMIVIVSLTAITNYTIPSINVSNTVRLLRFPFMILAATFGLFGVMLGFTVLGFHLCSLRSFGVPYLSPIAPLSLSDLKDTFIRVPYWMMLLRPRLIGYPALQRQDANQKPGPTKRHRNVPTRRGKE
ncbi:MAG: spore germination protein [Bacillota bacterium]|jgi:spore germination protein KA